MRYGASFGLPNIVIRAYFKVASLVLPYKLTCNSQDVTLYRNYTTSTVHGFLADVISRKEAAPHELTSPPCLSLFLEHSPSIKSANVEQVDVVENFRTTHCGFVYFLSMVGGAL